MHRSLSMAVTHADLAPSPKCTELGSKTGAFLTVFTILCGLLCFIFCLFAEATRSEDSWMTTNNDGKKSKYECVYSGSGKTPLLCASGAFLVLAIGMVVEHMYLLIALNNSTPSPLAALDLDSGPAKVLSWQAAFFFVTTWICFAVGEVLLLVGLSVESGHLTDWSTPRQSCLVTGEGLFSAAGVFGLTSVFLAAGLYLTALRAQKLGQAQEIVRRQVLEASVLYASPPRSPRHGINPTPAGNPSLRADHNRRNLSDYLFEFDKISSLM
ncbi:DESIGUAL/Modifying wall lignin-1/2 [Dillenia turbinata]|uniref:DESIGUAL/Modifying wall lignin-1/2 n=1 Tax=Dillenia turbinata TaxID=194707 RepID=A0AAN8UE16_9MAGN